jgi:hypothetical protein
MVGTLGRVLSGALSTSGPHLSDFPPRRHPEQLQSTIAFSFPNRCIAVIQLLTQIIDWSIPQDHLESRYEPPVL